MKYAGMPQAMWILFEPSFEKQLGIVYGYDKETSKNIMSKAKPKYREIIADLPEFEKADQFKMNIVNAAMIASVILNMPKRPDVESLTKYYADSVMIPVVKYFCRLTAKGRFTEKNFNKMRATAALKAAERNPFSWNMEFYLYPDSSGYEARFSKCGICVLMKKLGLYDLTPALCRLDYDMNDASGTSNFVREYTLASGGPYCDCGYKKI